MLDFNFGGSGTLEVARVKEPPPFLEFFFSASVTQLRCIKPQHLATSEILQVLCVADSSQTMPNEPQKFHLHPVFCIQDARVVCVNPSHQLQFCESSHRMRTSVVRIFTSDADKGSHECMQQQMDSMQNVFVSRASLIF